MSIAMHACHQLAPRILVYPADCAAPHVEKGWLALPHYAERAKNSRVFGDGSHPTTRLCAAAVDILCRQKRQRAVLDVGTGTGILARIARTRGASFVVGTDVDPAALALAAEHAALDADSEEIQWSSAAPDFWGPRFDLVVANILEQPLEALAPSLVRALAPSGVLLLSGFTQPQTPALRCVYQREQLRLIRQATLEDWALLMFEK